MTFNEFVSQVLVLLLPLVGAVVSFLIAYFKTKQSSIDSKVKEALDKRCKECFYYNYFYDKIGGEQDNDSKDNEKS